MKRETGFFAQDGSPCLKFRLRGSDPESPWVEVTGIFDSGFTGFVRVPLQDAAAFGLSSHAATSYTMANDAKVACSLAMGTVAFAGATVEGVICLWEGSQEILIGMDLLRLFGVTLVMSSSSILLVDQEWLDDAVKRAAEKTEEKDAEGEPDVDSPQTVPSD
jgi:predicted aspartyl protease